MGENFVPREVWKEVDELCGSTSNISHETAQALDRLRGALADQIVENRKPKRCQVCSGVVDEKSLIIAWLNASYDQLLKDGTTSLEAMAMISLIRRKIEEGAHL